MSNEKMSFKVIDEKGNEIECEVLFTFESDETGKNYIVYTDNTTDDLGNTKVYASIYKKRYIINAIKLNNCVKKIDFFLQKIRFMYLNILFSLFF